MKAILIAEKSSLMKEIESVYKKYSSEVSFTIDFDCFAGHIIARKEPKEYEAKHPEWNGPWADISLPMIPEPWELKIANSTIYKRLTEKIKKGNYDFIINACDPDREGMAIFELFREKSGIKLPVKRFWTNDLTEKAIHDALLNLRDNNEPALKNLKDASLIRGEFDWLVGMNFTIGYSLQMKDTAKVGRVKTPTLAILVRREKEILNFKPVITYEVESEFENGLKSVYMGESKEPYKFTTKVEADTLINKLNSTATVKSFSNEVKKKKAPKLFKMSLAQTEGSKAFGYNAEEVLSIIQYLYEQKILSYPRTDCEFLSSEMVKSFPRMLKSVAKLDELAPFVNRITEADIQRVAKDSSYINDKKLAESGHSAIVPTENIPDLSILEERLAAFNKEHHTKLKWEQVKKMLTLVYKRFLGIFMPEHESILSEAVLDNNGYTFRGTGSRVTNLGYMELYTSKMNDNSIPELKENMVLSVAENKTVEKQTTKPNRFDDGSLIAVMENPAKYIDSTVLKSIIQEKNGIGTPATRAEIIKELINNEYVARKKKSKGKGDYLVPTAKGISLIDNLEGESIASVDMTGEWEQKLKEVEKGSMSASALRSEMNEYIKQTISGIQSKNYEGLTKNKPDSIGICPLCGKDVRKSKGRFFCMGFKEGCKYGFREDAIKKLTGKNITDSNVKEILETGKLKKQKGKSKDGKTYPCWFNVKFNPESGWVEFEMKFK